MSKDEQLVVLVEPPGWVAVTAVVAYVGVCLVPCVAAMMLLQELGTGDVPAGLVAVALLIGIFRVSAARAGRGWNELCVWNARRTRAP